MIIFLPLFIILISVLAYLRKRSTRTQQEAEDRFWEREQQANNTRRKDISSLPYLTIPLADFPIGICKTEEINALEDTLTSLSQKKILNLGGQTNTDLKLNYGAANLNELAEYDENFTVLCRTLDAYAKALVQENHPVPAIPVLEYAVSCGSDLRSTYNLLADLYQQTGKTDSIAALTTSAKQLDSLLRDSIVADLEARYPSAT
ncbi:MAG: hypothetical protein ACI4AD_04300 [Roseburia sp.]